MLNNTFKGNRFLLLSRQQFIHHHKLMWQALVAYMGIIFIVLNFIQLLNERRPLNPDTFLGFLIGFVGVFGLLLFGHSFPAFRSKESTINYLMLPGSLLEKFLFELLSRIGIIILLLPMLYWFTFHLQGYLFAAFSDIIFEPVWWQDLKNLDITVQVLGNQNQLVRSLLFGSLIFLVYTTSFTGSAMFSKQPLIKTLFAVAIILLCYFGYSYLVVFSLGVGEYNPPDNLWLFPKHEFGPIWFITIASMLSSVIMLLVAYLKLKEREV